MVRISAIMPTADRRQFVPKAIGAFLAQARTDSELVILDDGRDSIADLIPADERIRYFRETPRQPLGAKRNRLCELARGEVIVHWDDDDWHSPDRLSRQLAALEASGADICGCDRLLFLSDDECQAWEYVYSGSRPWVAGGTLCYRRSVWQQRRFSTAASGEDTLWVFAARRESLHIMADNSFYVARVHSGNTCRKQVRGTWWKPRDAASVRAIAQGTTRAPDRAPTDLNDLTIVIPHGGRDRLPLLVQTLAGLREALPSSPIVITELGDEPCAKATAERYRARHLFHRHMGEFERARALNLGSSGARTRLILWHDNDVIARAGFYERAVGEFEECGLDFLIPFSSVLYFSEADTRTWLQRGSPPPSARPLRTLHSGRQASGGLGLVKADFLERFGGLDERFRGWGGEDDAWWHKASLLGRAAVSSDTGQVLSHLYHPCSGGLAGDEPRKRNPHYADNLAVLGELLRLKTAEAYLARHPPPKARPAISNRPCQKLPLYLYWEGPCPHWIRRCRETLIRNGGEVRLLDRAGFEALRTDDRDIDLDRLGPAHRADYVRAYLLAHHGGIWLDSDCILMKPLTQVYEAATHRGFVAHRDRQGYYPNGFIAAALGNPIARAFYDRVAARLRDRTPLIWVSLGGEPLTRLLSESGGGFHELPCEAIQPICWSEPGAFFHRGSDEEHEGKLDKDALTYMLSYTSIRKYLRARPGFDLLANDSFFSFLLRKSLGQQAPAALPCLPEAGTGSSVRDVFESFHAAALKRSDPSLSGGGSSLEATARLRQELPSLIASLGAGVMLDAGCGDHFWLKDTPLPVRRYIGVDVVADLIQRNLALRVPDREFVVADFASDDLPSADIVLTRDTLVHYDFETALAAISNLKRTGARFLLATTFPDRPANQEVMLGGWRPLNLCLPPFNFPKPLTLITEGCSENGGAYRDKALGLWSVQRL